jgi:hypothetical protein
MLRPLRFAGGRVRGRGARQQPRDEVSPSAGRRAIADNLMFREAQVIEGIPLRKSVARLIG